jgi:hypothetical protein
MDQRGVLYLVWNDTDRYLNRSISSLRALHPDLPVHVQHLPPGSTLLSKARLSEYSPFETTLYLDADTVVLGRLDFGFNQAERHGLACCICEAPQARRFPALQQYGDIVEYNTGVLFWHTKAKPLFDEWSSLAPILDSKLPFLTIEGRKVMPENDQASFALAVHNTDFNPFILPLNYNLRPMWQKGFFGDIKIWHDYGEVPQALLTWNKSQTTEGAIIAYAELKD